MLLHQPELGQGHTSYSKKVGSGQLFQWVENKSCSLSINKTKHQIKKLNKITLNCLNLDTKKEGVGESNVKLQCNFFFGVSGSL